MLELELELMLEQWDIIGVYSDSGGGMPADPARRTAQHHEYDDLVRPIIAHLISSDDPASLEAALIDVLRNDYGLTVSTENDGKESSEEEDVRNFARSVTGWWRSR